MRVTIAQLEAFFWTAQLGSASKAARHLNIAQPTVSLRLSDLEASLGVELFERVGRALRPTHDGQSLLPRAAVVLGELDRIREQGGQSEVSGAVRVGFAEGFAMVCLPPLLGLLRQDYQALRPEFVVATSDALERDLAGHVLDMAFLVNPVGHRGIRLVPLGVQETVWAAAPSWKLPARARPADLWQLPIVTNPPPSAMFRQITDWFAQAGIEPSRLDICSSVAMIAHLVESGAAIGVLPTKMIEPQVLAGTIRVVPSAPPIEGGRVYASYHDGAKSGPVDAIIRSVRQILSSIDYLRVDL
jgi:DNA-binding transcriptional LysR family regulator